MKKTILLLAGIASLWTVPVLAEPSAVAVSYAGLDLTSASGQSVFDRRVDQAVRTICGHPDLRDLSAVRASRQCTSETMALTRPRMALAVAAFRPTPQVVAAR